MPKSQKNEDLEPQESFSPSMAELLDRAVNSRLYDVRTCMPGEVIKYDSKRQCVDVQPLLKKDYDDEVLDMSQVYNVPVVFPRAGEAFLHLPLKKGDTVLLVIADRSVDKWKSTGGKVNPEDSRKHSLSDAFAIPGGYSFKHAASVSNGSDLILKNANAEIQLKSNGKVSISNGGQELVALLQSLAQTAQSMAQKVVAEVPAVAAEAAKFAQLASQIKGFVA